MLNGKLKSHYQLWDALLKVEKIFETKDDEVTTVSNGAATLFCKLL